MKIIASRRLLNTAVYKIAILTDAIGDTPKNIELESTGKNLYFILDKKEIIKNGSLVFYGNTSQLSIEIEQSEEGKIKVDFRELCQSIASIPKEVSLVQLEITDKKLSIKKV